MTQTEYARYWRDQLPAMVAESLSDYYDDEINMDVLVAALFACIYGLASRMPNPDRAMQEWVEAHYKTREKLR